MSTVNTLALKRKRRAAKLVLGLAIILAERAAAAAPLYDATADFSLAGNPNGVWSYGTTGTSLSGSFNMFPYAYDGGNILFWNNGWYPLLQKAVGSDYTLYNSVLVPENTLAAHPAPLGEFAVLKFTAPDNGHYQISASFWGDDYIGPTTTDVHISLGSTELFSSYINGYGESSRQNYSGGVFLSKGDSLDFSIGFGRNRDFGYDTTGLSVRITEDIPEPATMALLSIALFGFLISRKKRFWRL
jgi:hypothetical protein